MAHVQDDSTAFSSHSAVVDAAMTRTRADPTALVVKAPIDHAESVSMTLDASVAYEGADSMESVVEASMSRAGTRTDLRVVVVNAPMQGDPELALKTRQLIIFGEEKKRRN